MVQKGVLLYTASGFDPISGINQWTTLVKDESAMLIIAKEIHVRMISEANQLVRGFFDFGFF